jgi:hypothetical protein
MRVPDAALDHPPGVLAVRQQAGPDVRVVADQHVTTGPHPPRELDHVGRPGRGPGGDGPEVEHRGAGRRVPGLFRGPLPVGGAVEVEVVSGLTLGVEGYDSQRGRLLGLRRRRQVDAFGYGPAAQDAAERVIGQTGHQGRVLPEPGQADGHVVRAAARGGGEFQRRVTRNQIDESLADHGHRLVLHAASCRVFDRADRHPSAAGGSRRVRPA